MKRKIFSVLAVLVLAVMLVPVMAAPAPVAAAEEGTNYSPFGSVVYIWGADHSDWANNIKWFCLGSHNGGDGAQWDGHQITIVNSQWPEFNGQAYLKWAPCERLEWFTLWRTFDGTNFSDQVTTTKTGSIGEMEGIPAAESIDGWVDFDPAVDTVGDPRETVGNMAYMWYAHESCLGDGNLEVKFGQAGEDPPNDKHGFYHGWYLELVECGWTDLNGGWYLKHVADDGGGGRFGCMDRYQLYHDAGFTQPGIPDDPAEFVQYGGTEGLLDANSGRFVAGSNIAVGMAAEVEQITAINVEPGSISFGKVTPGTSVLGESITVENIGTVLVDVSAALGKSGTVFEYLEMDSVSPPSGWPGIIGLRVGTTATPIKTELVVPSNYSAKGVERNILIFTAKTY